MKKVYYLSLALFIVSNIECLSIENTEKTIPWDFDFSVYIWPYQERFVKGQEVEKAPPLVYKKGDDYIPLNLSVAMKAPWYDYKSTEPFTLYIQKKNIKGETIYRPYSRPRNIPIEGKRIMLFVYPYDKDPTTNLKLSIPIETFDEYFPPGHDKFANFTNNEMFLKVADEKVLLSQLGSSYFDTSKYEGKQLPILLLKKNEYDEWQRAFATNVFAPKDTKMMYIFFESRQIKGRLRLYSINVN